MSVIGELLVEINGDNSGLKKTMGESTNAVTAGIGKMVSAIGLASLAWKAVDLAMKGIDYNKAAEQAEIAFGSFLGSATAAKEMIEELRDLAKETPLEFAEVRDAAKQLSAFGVEAGRIIPTMRTLADVSAGLGIPVKDLAYLFGTIKTQGKAMTVDLMQFANRGIPIWEELAKVTGKSGTELRKLVEAGGVGFPQIEQAFKNMTSEGGKFFNMAVKQMDSLAGSQSNLNDAFDVWLGHIMEGTTGPLKDWNTGWASFFSAWVEFDKKYTPGVAGWNEAIGKFADQVNPMTQLFRSLGFDVGVVRDGLKGVTNQVNNGSAKMGEFRDILKEVKELTKTQLTDIGFINLKVEKGIITEKQGLEQKIKLREENIDKAYKELAAGKLTKEQFDEYVKTAIAFNKENKASLDAINATVEKTIPGMASILRDSGDIAKYTEHWASSMTDNIVPGMSSLLSGSEEFYTESKKLDELWKEIGFTVANTFNAIASGLETIGTLIKNAYDDQITQLTGTYDEERERIENNGLTRKEALEKNLAEALAAGDAEAKDKAQKELDLYNLQADFERKKANLQYQSALASWQMQVTAAGAKVAEAAVNAFASSAAAGPAGLIAAPGAALAAGAWAALAAAPVLAAMPQPPAFANGTNYAPGGMALVGERGPELVELPRGSRVKTAEETSRMGIGNATIQVMLDSRMIAESTVKLIDNGVVKVKSLAR